MKKQILFSVWFCHYFFIPLHIHSILITLSILITPIILIIQKQPGNNRFSAPAALTFTARCSYFQRAVLLVSAPAETQSPRQFFPVSLTQTPGFPGSFSQFPRHGFPSQLGECKKRVWV